jgi:DNA-binding response OmpR family regulator
MTKLLVINNDIETMSLLKMWLEKRAFDVTYTGNLEEVPELVGKFNPGIILVDQAQVNVVSEIKKHSAYASIPVILMTGYTTRHMPLEKSFDAVIEKPFHPEALEKLIKKYI